MPKRYTITAALPYTNGPIHIGHLAGVYVPADIYARYLRIKGEDVAFICGSNEHGVAISIKAKKDAIRKKLQRSTKEKLKDTGKKIKKIFKKKTPAQKKAKLERKVNKKLSRKMTGNRWNAKWN